MPRLASLSVALLGVLLTIPGCTTLQQLASLQNVEFQLDRVSNAYVAGVDLDRLRGGGSLGALDLARLGTAVARDDVPLSFVLHVGAENPDGNSVPAQLVSWAALATPVGALMGLGGGFLVGFGARWAGGCTSGHAISGLADLQVPSLVAVIGFFGGGLVVTHVLLPLLLA